MKRIRLILIVCALTALLILILTSCASAHPAQSPTTPRCGALVRDACNTGTDRASGPSIQKASQKTKHRQAHNYYQTHQAITQK